MPTWFIRSEENILSPDEILHYNFHERREQRTPGWLPDRKPLRILLTSGASCPDVLVEAVIRRLAGHYNAAYQAAEKLSALISEFSG